jgi:prepilin-type N-terminal cleavage/methylation domain-containing protein
MTAGPRDRAGFTFIELLMVVIVLAILLVVAIPQYRKTVERNYRQQAQDILTTIYYGEKAYRVVNDKFIIPPAWADIFMDNPQVGAPPPITFAVTAAAAKTFTAQATRAAGSGPCAGQTMTINEAGPPAAGPWLACP